MYMCACVFVWKCMLVTCGPENLWIRAMNHEIIILFSSLPVTAMYVLYDACKDISHIIY